MSHLAICILFSHSSEFSVNESELGVLGTIVLDCHTYMVIVLKCLDFFFFRSQFDSCSEYDLELQLEFYDGSVKGKKRTLDIFISESAAKKITLNSTDSSICKGEQLFAAFRMGISV
ncbi:uncharacterized protein ZBAI_03430 [Zygosaccharomyces bailii ISA1307]|nr:uncharacterized protein ZBAI_03430 [Zygosaccharomyces bailii ISA1307]